MRNIVDNVIASIIVGAMSTLVGIILQSFGFSSQVSFGAALIALFVLVILFLLFRRFQNKWERALTQHLLEKALTVNIKDSDKNAVEFKKKVIGRVLKEDSGIKQDQESWMTVFPNQIACESLILEAFSKTKKARILTVRGERFFQGPRSLLLNACLLKLSREKGFVLEVLILSPDAPHITEELAETLGQDSSEEIRIKMRLVLQSLMRLVSEHKNVKVRCFNETPNFKILLFDDMMFVSSYASGSPKNDYSVEMIRMTREGDPLFISFEKLFDDQWKRSISPQ